MSNPFASPSEAKPPAWSIAALCCPPLLLGIIYILSTPQGQSFNERVFGRLYTLGAILMLGAYGVLLLGLIVLGVAAALVARTRRESPSWMPKLALAVNLFIPLAIFVYRSYF